jgi:phosphopantetheine adenylyltransferase
MPRLRVIRQHDRVSRRGVFPGSFNPLTIAHLEIARLARDAHNLEHVDLAVSTIALDKPTPPGPGLAERIELIEADVAEFDWLSVTVTDEQLIADIAEGYDVVIMGADKWEQVNDVRYYESTTARDDAIARLPTLAVARRAGSHVDDHLALALPEELQSVSSSAARAGKREHMAPEAARRWQ